LFVHGLVKTVYLLYRLIQDFERTGRGGPLLSLLSPSSKLGPMFIYKLKENKEADQSERDKRGEGERRGEGFVRRKGRGSDLALLFMVVKVTSHHEGYIYDVNNYVNSLPYEFEKTTTLPYDPLGLFHSLHCVC
jgi:hypothetical protein